MAVIERELHAAPIAAIGSLATVPVTVTGNAASCGAALNRDVRAPRLCRNIVSGWALLSLPAVE